MSNNRKIKIVVVGDSGSGKTTWISQICSNSYQERDQDIKVMPPIEYPYDTTTSQFENIITQIIDTASDQQLKEQVDKEIKRADVILLFYDISNRTAVSRLQTYWMERIKQLNSKVPVIIVGNKDDLFDEHRNNLFENKANRVIVPLIKIYRQVEMGIECSAINNPNIKDIIYCAERAVLYPLSPIYDITKQQLTLECQRAFKRIFRICDKDMDGLWSDQELTNFQIEVFKVELSELDIKGIKDIIKDELKKDSEVKQGITPLGFLTLQKKCVEQIKMQICWLILRHFGYGDDLTLKNELFQDEFNINRDQGQQVELSMKTLQFLSQIFTCFQNKHQRITLKELINTVFDPIGELPWENIKDLIQLENKFDEDNGINQESDQFQIQITEKQLNQNQWISLWNSKNTLSSLMRINQRRVFNIGLVGSSSRQRSLLINSIINKELQDLILQPESSIKQVVKSIDEQNKTLIFTEIPEIDLELFMTEQKKNQNLDIIILIYRSEQEARIFLEKNEIFINEVPIPRIQVQIQNDFIADNFSSKKSIDFGQLLVLKDLSNLTEFYEQILKIIENPKIGLTQSNFQELKGRDGFFSNGSLQLYIGIASITGIGLLFIFNKNDRFGIKKFFVSIKKILRF